MNDVSPTQSQKLTKSPGNNSSPGFKTLKSTMSVSPSKLSASSIFSPRDYYFNHNMSASVLQHSSSAHKFPQADRFGDLKNYTGPRSYCASPSSLSHKSTTMGFGGRVDVSQLGNKEAVNFPSPAKYQIKSEFDTNKGKGKTFGIPWSAYDRVYQPNSQLVPISYSKGLPGPGTYHSQKDPTLNMSKVTFAPKGKMFNENICLDSPKCTHYTPKNGITESSRFKKITFGFGDKYDFTKVGNANPGPGSYTPPSFVDKYRKKVAHGKNYSNSPIRKVEPVGN